MNRPVDADRLRATVTFLRGEFHNDGAEGESVHRVCADALGLLDELEATRKPACRFDVAAAREELARIDRAWTTAPCIEYIAARALLDRALAAIDAGWPEPATITDAMVEEAAILSWCSEGMSRDSWANAGAGLRGDYRRDARAVLEYAASLGIASAPAASRPFRQTPDMPELAILAACASARFTEEVTIERLSLRIATIENESARWHEVSASPRLVVPLAPPAKPSAERLTAYRCAAMPAVMTCCPDMEPPQLAAAVEAMAHAMLAAERSPT